MTEIMFKNVQYFSVTFSLRLFNLVLFRFEINCCRHFFTECGFRCRHMHFRRWCSWGNSRSFGKKCLNDCGYNQSSEKLIFPFLNTPAEQKVLRFCRLIGEYRVVIIRKQPRYLADFRSLAMISRPLPRIAWSLPIISWTGSKVTDFRGKSVSKPFQSAKSLPRSNSRSLREALLLSNMVFNVKDILQNPRHQNLRKKSLKNLYVPCTSETGKHDLQLLQFVFLLVLLGTVAILPYSQEELDGLPLMVSL